MGKEAVEQNLLLVKPFESVLLLSVVDPTCTTSECAASDITTVSVFFPFC
jgi:hypothetical protein